MIRELAGHQEAAVTQVSSGSGHVRPSEGQVPKEASAGDATRAVARLKDVAETIGPRLQYEIDPELQQVIVKVLNEDSGEVIRQIPSEEVVRLAKMHEHIAGLLVNERA